MNELPEKDTTEEARGAGGVSFSSARDFLSKIFLYFKQAFVRPLNDRERNALLFAGTVGIFFSSMQSMVLNYGVVAHGPVVTTAYHVLRFLFIGVIGFPLTFWILSFPSGKWGIVILQSIGVGCFLFGMKHFTLTALGFMFLAGPFWAVFLRAYGVHQSRENHNRETVLCIYAQMLASALGCFCGGFLLAWDAYTLAMLLCGTGVIASTFVMMPHIKKESLWELVRNFVAQMFLRENPYKKALALINPKWPTTQLTFLSSAVGALLEIGLPTWMGLVGIPPVSAGFSLGMRPVLGFVLTPVVGSLVERSSVRVGQLGAGFMVMGWLMMIFVLDYRFLLLPALAVLAVGTNMIAPAELGWWLKKRSAAGVMARELLLTMGRVPAIGAMVPVLFLLAPATFPFIGLAGSVVFFLGARRINRTISFRSALGWRASNRSQ